MPPVQTDYTGTITGVGGRTIGGDGRVTIIWCANERDRGDPGPDPSSEAIRASKTIFFRGVKEQVVLRTNTSVSWRWLRICFALKGINGFIPAIRTGVETNNGWARAMVDLSSVAAGTVRNQLESLLFEGAGGTDWVSPFSAKVDNSRVTLLYRHMRLLNSGNNNGRFFKHNQWLPVNKNIMYNDDEIGQDTNDSTRSVLSKPGIGDIFFVDFFECSSASSSDSLNFEPQATIYWHEK